MTYIFVAIAYLIFLLVLIRFFGAVHSWDEKIRSMQVTKIRKFRKLAGQRVS